VGVSPARLATLEKICRARSVDFGDMLELIDEPPKPKPKRTRKRREP
jgi:DNA-binding Xre family transcriptional regulator